MRFINTRIHGYLDYVIGFLLICAPWALGFDHIDPAKWTAIIIGAGAFFYSIITDYELGLLKLIPMSGHLIIDLLAGVVLAASPWIFGFSDLVFWPHLIVGILEIGVSLTTEKHPAKPETSVKHGQGSSHSSST